MSSEQMPSHAKVVPYKEALVPRRERETLSRYVDRIGNIVTRVSQKLAALREQVIVADDAVQSWERKAAAVETERTSPVVAIDINLRTEGIRKSLEDSVRHKQALHDEMARLSTYLAEVERYHRTLTASQGDGLRKSNPFFDLPS